MNEKRLAQIEKQIEKIKTQLQDISIMRPGSLTRQYKDPKEQSGAYYQLSYTYQMQSKTEYVRAQLVAEMRRQIREYKKFKKLIDQWVALAIKYSQLSSKLDRKHSQAGSRQRKRRA